MLKYIFFSVFFCFNLILIAQSVTLKGVVKDSLQNPLSFANVIAKPKNLAKSMKFAISDEEGRYSLELNKNENYSITVSFVGFEPFSEQMLLTKSRIKNIVLKEAKNQLEEVVIELPVTVKEDTIIYNVSKFINGKERKLKNILKKLPGVEVDRDGGVLVQGKKVTKLLVDGKKFFNGGTKLGVENIPAGAVDKVEVIDNYNEVAFLKNISDSDEMAMNIKLKENKKRFVFGDVEVGIGNKKYYKTHANLFYYSPKTTLNFIGNSNNINEKVFSFRDYLNFNGGTNALFKGNLDFSGGDFKQFIETNDVIDAKHHFGAINVFHEISSKLKLSGYAISSFTNSNSFQINQNQYVDFTEIKETTTNFKNLLGIGKFDFDYTPKENEQWYFKTLVKQTNNNRLNSISSTINTIENQIKTDNNSKEKYVNQNIEWYKKKSKEHTFSALMNYKFNKDTPNTFWETTLPILEGLIPVDISQNPLKIEQVRQIEKHYFNTVFKHFWVLNKHNHIYPTIGNTYQEQKFITTDNQNLTNGNSINFESAGFNNSTKYDFHDFFVGLHYKFRKGIFTLKQGAYLHRYHWRVSQQNFLNTVKWNLLPDFNAEIKFNNAKKLKINYQLKTNFSNVSKLANRFYLQSYNAVFKGNEFLENELFHSGDISYSIFSLYRGLTFLVRANYIKKIKGYRNSVNFDGINRFLSYELIDNPSENLSLNVNLRKKIKQIRYKLRGSYDTNNYLQNINNNFTTNKSTNYSLEFGAETLFNDFPLVEIGYKRTIGSYVSSNSVSEFITNKPFINIDFHFFNAFVLNFDYEYYDYQNEIQKLNNTYELANASLLYQKENSPWTFRFEAQNLLDAKFKRSNSFSDYLISDTKTFIMPRVLLFSIGYKL